MRHLHMGLDPQCFAIVEFPKNSFKICCLQQMKSISPSLLAWFLLVMPKCSTLLRTKIVGHKTLRPDVLDCQPQYSCYISRFSWLN